MKLPKIECRAGHAARWLVVFSLALLATGIWRIDGVLGAFGLAILAWLALARWLGRANLGKLTVAIDGPDRVTADMPYPLRVTLANPRRWLDAKGIELRATLPGRADVGFRSGWVAAGSAADFDATVTAKTRANGGVIGVSLESRHPFGWFRFRREIGISTAMVVLPRARSPRDVPDDGVMLDGSPLAGATPGGPGGDIRGLRDWRPGDSPRQIAWPATIRSAARGGALIVRESDPPGFLPRRCLVVLHSFASGGALIRPERFERALELAGGWIERLHGMGIEARLLADFDGWVPRPAATRVEIIRCRERLARAKRASSTEAHELQQAIAASMGGDESLILISDMPADSWSGHFTGHSPTPRIDDF